MAAIASDYESYTAESDRAKVLNTLDWAIEQPAYSFNDANRAKILQLILDDLAALAAGEPTRLTRAEAGRALLAVKTLGKIPQGAHTIGSPVNLRALLAVAGVLAADDVGAWSEAWRCVANTLLQDDGARTTWISADVGGGAAMPALLAQTSEPDRVFLLCRTLFLSSLSSAGPEGAYVKRLVEDDAIITTVAARLDELAGALTAGTKMAREATSEVLKFAFNILHLYPRIAPAEEIRSPIAAPITTAAEDVWDERLDGILPPLLRLLGALAPSAPTTLAPPLTHVVHALIAVPASPALLPQWFDEPAEERGKPPSRLDRARAALSRGKAPRTPPPGDAFEALRGTLDRALAHYLPGAVDPDDEAVRAGGLDDALAPLACVLARLCRADARARTRVGNWLWPADLDRSTSAGALEARPDALGRCLRLLSCVYHARAKDSIGELLYAAADSDAAVLSSLVGYGNVAGLLYAKGILSAPGGSGGGGTAPTVGPTINPITGVAHAEAAANAPEMSAEEKEREAEKLFVLFDRLERTGAIKPEQNPVRDAMRKAA